MKNYTDIEQSKVLAEILPLESADMYYFCQIDSDYFPPGVESICPIPLFKDGKEDFNYDIPCWSLSALLSVLPIIDDEFEPQLHRSLDKYRCTYEGEEDSSGLWRVADNSVDACYEMILKLHELNLL